ncbi:MAG: lysine--tRNA ligase [Candidatus Niyogibacteria bacterium]|nr:lysine--tRNA ligase [Candidatus Niyogibacteria bacterium]
MSTFDEIKRARIDKLHALKEKGIDPYPVETPKIFSIAEVALGFNKLVRARRVVSIAGRVMARREHGGSIFCDIFDGTGRVQVYFKKDALGDVFDLFRDTADIGDFIFVKGKPFLTKRKERTLEVSSWTMLTKTLLPLPEKWHGLTDTEERYRRRYLDILMNDEVRARFVRRSEIVSATRDFLNAAGFMEVETPQLQPLAGGATAAPFATHHNALDIDLYLRIAPELYLKELVGAGFPKVFEIGRNFRNEGIDATHNPEFTMLEFYEAHSDAAKQRVFVEKLFKTLAKKFGKKSKLAFAGEEIDLGKKFAVMTYESLIRKYALIPEPLTATRDDLALTAKRLGVAVDTADSREKILDNVYKKLCRPKLIQPTFIIDYPTPMLPLAKRRPGSNTVVDAFQLIIGGLELVKAFSELNDPIDQQARFSHEEEARRAGDTEAQPADLEVIEAMEYGFPPMGGVGIGIDRLVMLLTDTQNIREVVIFPTLRPRQ